MTRTQVHFSSEATAFINHGGRALTALAHLLLLSWAVVFEKLSRALVNFDRWITRQGKRDETRDRRPVCQ